MTAPDLSLLGQNLLRFRTSKGFSQADLASAAKLSRDGYRNIESGTASPRVDTLMRLAAALGVELQTLLAPVRTLHGVRFRAQKKMTTRGELLADVARWLDDYVELERIVGDKLTFGFAAVRPKLAGTKPGEERAKKAAALARASVGSGDGPIGSICDVLEANGVKVFTPKLASEGFFGLSVAEAEGGPAVIVNTWERLSVERWIFTAAHELGHLLMHLDAYDVAVAEEDAGQEKEADVFASHFLMPDALFQKKLDEARGLSLVKMVFKLKRFFRVSWKSVLYRIVSQTPNGGNLWGRFQGEYKALAGKTLGKADEPEGLGSSDFRPTEPSARVADEPEHLTKDDFVEDRLCRLVRKAVDDEAISLGRAAEILGIDLEKMHDLSNSWVP